MMIFLFLIFKVILSLAPLSEVSLVQKLIGQQFLEENDESFYSVVTPYLEKAIQYPGQVWTIKEKKEDEIPESQYQKYFQNLLFSAKAYWVNPTKSNMMKLLESYLIFSTITMNSVLKLQVPKNGELWDISLEGSKIKAEKSLKESEVYPYLSLNIEMFEINKLMNTIDVLKAHSYGIVNPGFWTYLLLPWSFFWNVYREGKITKILTERRVSELLQGCFIDYPNDSELSKGTVFVEGENSILKMRTHFGILRDEFSIKTEKKKTSTEKEVQINLNLKNEEFELNEDEVFDELFKRSQLLRFEPYLFALYPHQANLRNLLNPSALSRNQLSVFNYQKYFFSGLSEHNRYSDEKVIYRIVRSFMELWPYLKDPVVYESVLGKIRKKAIESYFLRRNSLPFSTWIRNIAPIIYHIHLITAIHTSFDRKRFLEEKEKMKNRQLDSPYLKEVSAQLFMYESQWDPVEVYVQTEEFLLEEDPFNPRAVLSSIIPENFEFPMPTSEKMMSLLHSGHHIFKGEGEWSEGESVHWFEKALPLIDIENLKSWIEEHQLLSSFEEVNLGLIFELLALNIIIFIKDQERNHTSSLSVVGKKFYNGDEKSLGYSDLLEYSRPLSAHLFDKKECPEGVALEEIETSLRPYNSILKHPVIYHRVIQLLKNEAFSLTVYLPDMRSYFFKKLFALELYMNVITGIYTSHDRQKFQEEKMIRDQRTSFEKKIQRIGDSFFDLEQNWNASWIEVKAKERLSDTDVRSPLSVLSVLVPEKTVFLTPISFQEEINHLLSERHHDFQFEGVTSLEKTASWIKAVFNVKLPLMDPNKSRTYQDYLNSKSLVILKEGLAQQIIRQISIIWNDNFEQIIRQIDDYHRGKGFSGLFKGVSISQLLQSQIKDVEEFLTQSRLPRRERVIYTHYSYLKDPEIYTLVIQDLKKSVLSRIERMEAFSFQNFIIELAYLERCIDVLTAIHVSLDYEKYKQKKEELMSRKEEGEDIVENLQEFSSLIFAYEYNWDVETVRKVVNYMSIERDPQDPVDCLSILIPKNQVFLTSIEHEEEVNSQFKVNHHVFKYSEENNKEAEKWLEKSFGKDLFLKSFLIDLPRLIHCRSA